MSKKGSSVIVILAIILIIVVVGVIVYFVSDKIFKSNQLSPDKCIYDAKKYITCGTAFVLVSKGIEYPLVANEKFYFPQGEDEMIGLVDQSKPKDEGSFLLFLKEGEYTINEETSRKAVGSFIAQN